MLLFDILKELNAYNIIDSLAGNSMFSKFHKGILAISITILGLFALFKFIMKIIEPDEGLSSSKLVTEIVKSTLFVLLSVFLFSQVSTFSIKLSGFTASIFSNNNVTISDNMLIMFVDYSEQYKLSDQFEKEDYKTKIKNYDFTNAKMYNDKFDKLISFLHSKLYNWYDNDDKYIDVVNDMYEDNVLDDDDIKELKVNKEKDDFER